MTDLKTCPFCRGPAERYTLQIVTPMLNRRIEKKCIGCFRCEAFVMAKFEDDAIGKWNRRADQ